jgi:UDP:flavonoid glycosyltransferase YjiC (YdhE family)
MQLGRVLPREQLTPETIRAAVDEVLTNPRYRRNVERLQREMYALPGQASAVELVERVVAGGALPLA